MSTFLCYAANDSQRTTGGYNACLISDTTSPAHALVAAQAAAPQDMGNPAPIANWSTFFVTSTAIPSTVFIQGQAGPPLVKGRGT